MIVSFVTGNPALGEGALNAGFLRLSAPPADAPAGAAASSALAPSLGAFAAAPLPRERSTLLAMLGVPSRFVPSDLISVLGPWRDDIAHVRVARHCEPPKWPPHLAVVLLLFTSARGADECYAALHGRPFNSFEPDWCCLAFALAVECGGASPRAVLDHALADQELVCVVCLEPLLAAPETGAEPRAAQICTTACDHTFHTACLARCADAPCAVCRYHHARGDAASTTCHVCGCAAETDDAAPARSAPPPPRRTRHVCEGKTDDDTDDDEELPIGETRQTLWVCMICGHVGCGATLDASSHARDHFRATLHAYALDVRTRHVWDFAGEGYVHRLVLQKDGFDEDDDALPRPPKLYEIGGPNMTAPTGLSRLAALQARAPVDDKCVHRKLEGLALEYNELLQSQLMRQRESYDARLAEIDDVTFGRRAGGRDGVAALAKALQREQAAVEARSAQARARLAKTQEDEQFLRDLNASLSADAARWHEDRAAAVAELAKARRDVAAALKPLEDELAAKMAL
ncbi:hypothetical protein M885DRAFT_545709 [Pelagophyceae sp. CCMP2097]|nr:hypothetical protein M885DRAFT_545709 [Pelagophyceae sp. CCMP2097]